MPCSSQSLPGACGETRTSAHFRPPSNHSPTAPTPTQLTCFSAVRPHPGLHVRTKCGKDRGINQQAFQVGQALGDEGQDLWGRR